MAERFVNREQFADILGISRQRVRTLESHGKLPPPDAMLADRPLWKYDTAIEWARVRAAANGLQWAEPGWASDPQPE